MYVERFDGTIMQDCSVVTILFGKKLNITD